MAKKAYIGVDGKARKIKKGYIGIGGKARKIKKAYIGVGGVARPCWSGGELAYYGEITDLSTSRRSTAATSNGNHALFAGGYDGSKSVSTVDAYDKNLVHTAAPDLGSAKQRAAGARAGNYAVFAGGASKDPSSALGKYKTVDAYDRKLTRTSVTSLTNGMYDYNGITLGECALFAGNAAADCYDNRLAKVNATAPSGNRMNAAAGVIGDFGIFIGGGASYSTATNTADAYLA